MDLKADDFGCVADGRFLTGVSVVEGSAVLTALGGLRLVDVGKQIAVPGAADLAATIAALVERLDVSDASMVAGSPLLTGTPFDPDRPAVPLQFRLSLHVGRRISVAGAGPSGSTLLSRIIDVKDATTVVLAETASTAVTGATTIVNDPAVVGLSNYARRSLDGLQVDLGDRSVSDGVVRLGGRALSSDTALFSSEDLGKTVTLRAAGLLVATIASVETSAQLTLSAAAPRTVSDVAADVWRTDSRPGLTQLLGALPSLDTESAEIRFGPGVYDFTRIPPELNDPMAAAIGLRGLQNLTIRGSGIGATILRLMPDQDLHGPDSHVIETRDCRNLTLRDLSIHGAYLTMGNTNEQMHGINLNAGTQEMVIERVAVFQTAGDGIRLLGQEANKVRKVWIDDCRLVQNKRTGIAFQRASEFVWVRGCHIESREPSTDASIDFEPSGTAAPTDVILDSNTIDHDTPAGAVSLAGISGPDPARRVKFTNNIVRGGSVFCVDVDHLSIQDNTITIPDNPNRPTSGIPVHVQRGGHGVIITGNVLVSEHPAAAGMIVISEVNNRPVDRAMIAHNLCFTRAGFGILVQSCEDVAVDDNLLVATGQCTQSIAVNATSVSDVSSISVRDNEIATENGGSWDTGIQIGGGKTVQHITVTGNAVGGADVGVRFQGNNLLQTPICALNRIRADVTTPLAGLSTLPEHAIIVAGAASRGGDQPGQGAGRVLAGAGNPNDNQVVGNLGDIYQRVDPEAGPRLFVKEADDTAGTGWTPK